jgi:hypothetical protein
LARDIDRKLRLTAALLGAATRKDLAAAFRKISPATPFDVNRAHKWMQGRAQPRELQLYADLGEASRPRPNGQLDRRMRPGRRWCIQVGGGGATG